MHHLVHNIKENNFEDSIKQKVNNLYHTNNQLTNPNFYQLAFEDSSIADFFDKNINKYESYLIKKEAELFVSQKNQAIYLKNKISCIPENTNSSIFDCSNNLAKETEYINLSSINRTNEKERFEFYTHNNFLYPNNPNSQTFKESYLLKNCLYNLDESNKITDSFSKSKFIFNYFNANNCDNSNLTNDETAKKNKAKAQNYISNLHFNSKNNTDYGDNNCNNPLINNNFELENSSNFLNLNYINFTNTKLNHFNNNKNKATENINCNNTTNLINYGINYILNNEKNLCFEKAKTCAENSKYNSTISCSKSSGAVKLLGKKTKKPITKEFKFGCRNSKIHNFKAKNSLETKRMEIQKIKDETKIFNKLITQNNQNLTKETNDNAEFSAKSEYIKKVKNNKLVYVFKNNGSSPNSLNNNIVVSENKSDTTVDHKLNYNSSDVKEKENFAYVNEEENASLNGQTNKEASTGDLFENCSEQGKKEELSNECLKSIFLFLFISL